MGRPSLKEKRSDEILDAFARCVGRYGLEGSTLERIAEEAGVKRTILRHYIGNRDEMITALAERVAREFDQATDELFALLPDEGRVDWLVEALFHPSSQTSSQDLAVAQALISASDHYPDIGKQQRAWVLRFDDLIAQELAAAYPQADAGAVREVSFGLLSIYFNTDALGPLRLPEAYVASGRQAAKRLISTLEG